MGVNNRDFNHHQYRFYNSSGNLGKHGCVTKSPCRSSVKKLTPEAVLNRAELCDVVFWDRCILVDNQDQVLDTMTKQKAWSRRYHDIMNKITKNLR